MFNNFQLGISSDVLNKTILINFSSIIWPENVLGEFRPDLREKVVNKVDLIILQIEVICFLDEMLAEGNMNYESGFATYSDFDYRGRKVRLNLRKDRDFKIAAVIGYEYIINKTIERNGNVYIFNRTVLAFGLNANVISLLKVKNGLDETQIQDEIKMLSTKYDLNIHEFEHSLKLALVDLSNFGYIDCDRDGFFKLTAKGYMLSI